MALSKDGTQIMLDSVIEYNQPVMYREQMVVLPAVLWSQIVEALNDPSDIDDELKQMVLEAGGISKVRMSPNESEQLRKLREASKP